MKKAYIIALADSLLTGGEIDGVLSNAKQLLIKKGYGRLWPLVLRGALRELERRSHLNTPQVKVAIGTAEKNERLIKALVAVGADASSPYQVSVDSTLIGGFIVRYRDQMFDASYKKALINLYRKVTKS